MKYDIVFYMSKKTGYCERKLKKLLGSVGGELSRSVCAPTPTTLGEEVCLSLRLCPLTVIVGGLRSADDDNLAVVLSRVLSNSSLTLNNLRKLTASSHREGYIIRYKNQIMLALPDSPDDIEEMLTPELISYISEKVQTSR